MSKETVESARLLEHLSKQAMIGQLKSNMAHEILNMTSTSAIYLQILKSKSKALNSEDPTLQSTLDRFEKVIEQISAIASSVQVANKPPKKVSLSVFQLVSSAFELSSEWINYKSVKTQLDLNEKIHVYCDQTQIIQIITNMIVNSIQAIQHLPERWIRVWASQTDSEVLIHFQDSGLGLSQKAVENLMTPYFTTKENGTGLGLYVSHLLAQENGGKLQYCQDFKNTTFILTLPISRGSEVGENLSVRQ